MKTRDRLIPPRSDLQLLEFREFADALGLGTPTVRRWISQRRVAAVRVGSRAIRIPATEVERIVSEGLIPVRPDRRG
jgi:excisionase family DNA binding protein